MNILDIQALSKNFGGVEVLKQLNFSIPKGKIYGLIGPNGAGKTTVFNLITGLIKPTSGSIQFNQKDMLKLEGHQISNLGIARTFQNIRIFKEMNLIENVVAGMHIHTQYNLLDIILRTPKFKRIEIENREKAMEFLSWLDLDSKANQRADSLSYGEQRKLEIARALSTQPQLLLLDEPVAGMNSFETDVLMTKIQEINQRGYTILLIEHDMKFVMGLCENIGVLHFGHLIAEGNPEEIKSNQAVIDAYLGTTH